MEHEAYRNMESGELFSRRKLRGIWSDPSQGVSDLSFEEFLEMEVSTGYYERV